MQCMINCFHIAKEAFYKNRFHKFFFKSFLILQKDAKKIFLFEIKISNILLEMQTFYQIPHSLRYLSAITDPEYFSSR